MKNISYGKYLNLQKCTTQNGAFSILALDHRNNLRKALNPKNPKSVKNDVLTGIKMDISSCLSGYASSILLDPEIGVFPAIANSVIDSSVGLVVALEATGYTGDPTERKSGILEGWSVEKVKMIGANAAKLLVYYHPQSKTAPQIEELVSFVEEECARFDILFLLEILTYSIDQDKKKLHGKERSEVIIESARRLSALGADVLKMEFPLDIIEIPEKRAWDNACKELTSASSVPWVLLSASVDFDTYLEQVSSACRSGALGIAAGRAVWKEAILKENAERIKFLRGQAGGRMRRLTSLVNAQAPGFSSLYEISQSGKPAFKTYFMKE
jgi:tagatose-1,6-bisphosphate aldolase